VITKWLKTQTEKKSKKPDMKQIQSRQFPKGGQQQSDKSTETNSRGFRKTVPEDNNTVSNH
jgi:hypothetical protein